MSYAATGRYGVPYIDVPCVNASTGTITQYMVVERCGGQANLAAITALTTTLEISPGVGDSPLFHVSACTLDSAGNVLGVVQSTLPPLTLATPQQPAVGLCRIFGATWVRVASAAQAVAGSVYGAEGSPAGSILVTTGGMGFFTCWQTSQNTMTLGYQTVIFSTAHAYGWLSTFHMLHGRVRA